MLSDVEAVLRSEGARPHARTAKPYLMDFERQFVLSPSGVAPTQCYEAARLHRQNLHVRNAADQIRRRKCD